MTADDQAVPEDPPRRLNSDGAAADDLSAGDTRPSLDALDLDPAHRELIEGSAIAPEVAIARGYRTARRKSELGRLGFGGTQQLVPALVVPVYGVDGEIATYQIRPDTPRVKDGRPIKYETPAKTRLVIDVPRVVRRQLGDPAIPLWVTEGARKADAAASAGLCCISLMGVWNWRGRNPHGGKVALADWESIALNGRVVYLAFDSDAMTKPGVHDALARLSELLQRRDAKVRFVYIPETAELPKAGLDDYFAAGGTVEELVASSETSLRPLPVEVRDPSVLRSSPPYLEREKGLYVVKHTSQGEQEVQLTNFRARIEEEVRVDDGIGSQLLLKVRLTLGERDLLVDVPASQFPSMKWVLPTLGGSGVVSAGLAQTDHARAAIQMLSTDIRRSVSYAHTGWRQVEGRWVYLHRGGAITAEGTISECRTQLPQEFAPLDFATSVPDRPAPAVIRSSLALLDLAGAGPDGAGVMVPILGLLYRAVLGPTDVSVHITGQTGTFKSELLALVMQHFGCGYSRYTLASWSSTENYLEELSFVGKDAVLPIDDFVPTGSAADRRRFEAKADRVFRGSGNRSGRGRMNAGGDLRPRHPSRAMVFSTGEDTPQQRSGLARIVVIELAKGAITPEALTGAQRRGCRGDYAQAMRLFIQWIAGNYDAVQAAAQSLFLRFRDACRTMGSHRRDPEKAAHVLVGWSIWLTFATEAEAITEAAADDLFGRCWRAVPMIADAQRDLQQDSDPVDRFLSLVPAALASGSAHLASPSGERPQGHESRAGWVLRSVGDSHDWQPRGSLIGWLDGDHLYLEPNATLKAANAISDQVDLLPSASTLGKRLNDRGLLTDSRKGRLKVQRTLSGVRREVWQLAAETVLPVAERPNRPNRPADTQIGVELADLGPRAWDAFAPPADAPDQKTSHTELEVTADFEVDAASCNEWDDWDASATGAASSGDGQLGTDAGATAGGGSDETEREAARAELARALASGRVELIAFAQRRVQLSWGEEAAQVEADVRREVADAGAVEQQ